MSEQRSPEHLAAQDRYSAYREKAERRGRIRHPEGDRYETPDWLDVLVLLDENDRLRDALNGILSTVEDANRPYERLTIGALARAGLGEA